MLSQRIINANNITVACVNGEKTAHEAIDSWNEVLDIIEYCGNISSYQNAYQNLNSNIKEIEGQLLNDFNTKYVMGILKQIEHSNEGYVFNPIIPGGNLYNDIEELKRLQQIQSHILDERGRQNYQEQTIDKYIREVISFDINDNLKIVIRDLENNSQNSELEKNGLIEIAIVRALIKECNGSNEINDIYFDVPDRIEEIVLERGKGEDRISGDMQEQINNIKLFLDLPIIDEDGNIVKRNGIEEIPFNEVWDKDRIYTANTLTRRMVLEGYDYKFICGLVGNIACEGGKFGKFEDMHFTESNPNVPEPYQDHMNNVHLYDDVCGAETLEEMGIATFKKMLFDTYDVCSDKENHKFGLGCIQWTDHERSSELYKLYENKYGENYYPNMRECASVELEYIVEEIGGDYNNIYTDWQVATEGKNLEEAIYSASEEIMKKYEKPKNQNIEERNAYAQDWGKIFE